ncbi:hypothetical protein FNV43_RR09579 [Rhamnella rubrinervis]|uniref:Uncharacterized protein n=1 Tax=Rhamnella rubrinervis TaxID=2594499 RepID=A0A8K0HB22_9ROSA|nr:hypothetical protein FNV43_RR09579 [Rhamnella rubrinervis]
MSAFRSYNIRGQFKYSPQKAFDTESRSPLDPYRLDRLDNRQRSAHPRPISWTNLPPRSTARHEEFGHISPGHQPTRVIRYFNLAPPDANGWRYFQQQTLVLRPQRAAKSRPANLGLEDSSSIRRIKPDAPIVDCLMTRHDKSIQEHALEDIRHEANREPRLIAPSRKGCGACRSDKQNHEADILEFKQAAIDVNAPRKPRKWSKPTRSFPKRREPGILGPDFSPSREEMNGAPGSPGHGRKDCVPHG